MESLPGLLAVLALTALILLPSLVGLARERAIDRQLRAAAGVREGAADRSSVRGPVRGAPASAVPRTQKSSPRSTEPSTAT
ncbi:hypothetical protein [Streptomyces sp. NPDC014894]|uniref:hypothetical protein n=1 Tax=unclassified Streptomyces TaxID=2593676 RepID=UPI0036FE8E58